MDGKVLIIGAGGLGSPAALYLAAAGVGTIGIVDGDRVDLSNIRDVIKEYDFIIDGTDNFAVKFLINAVCFMSPHLPILSPTVLKLAFWER